MCAMVLMQYNYFKIEAQKMVLVRQEYHQHLGMLKKAIQDKYSDEVTDDLDLLEDNKSEEDNKNSEEEIPLTAQQAARLTRARRLTASAQRICRRALYRAVGQGT